MPVCNIDFEEFTPQSDPDAGRECLLFDRAPVPMWIFDQENLGFLAVNDAAVLKYGYSRGEFLALTIADIRPSDDLSRLRRELATQVQDSSLVKGGVWKHKSKAGEIFDVEITSTALQFEGRPSEMVAAYDVTARVREQQGMAIRYALNRLLVESSVDATQKVVSALCDWMDFDLVEMWYPYAGNKMLLRKMYWQPPDDPPLEPAASPVLLESDHGVLAQTWTSGWPAWIEDFSSQPGYRDRLSDLQKAGLSEGIVFAIRDHSGTIALVALLSRKRRDKDHQTIELIRDLGAQIGQHLSRCRAEKESRKSAASFRALFDDAPMPYHEIDRSGLVVRVNRAECELLGVSAADLIGKPVWNLVDPEERNLSREAVRSKFAEGSVLQPYERTYRTSSGEKRIFQIHERLITQPDGEVSGIRTAMLDQSATRESERKIEFQADLLDQVGDAIITMDLDFKTTYWNEAAERMFAVRAEDAIGKDYRSLATVELSPEERQAIFATISEHGCWRGETTIVNRLGERMVLDISDSALRGPSGDLQGIVAILRDITQRKRIEESLRSTEDRLTLAQSAIAIGSWEVDLKTGVSRCSEQLLRLFGISEFREGVQPEEWARSIHPEDRDRVVAEVAATVEQQSESDRQYRVIWPDSSVHWLHSKTRVMLDANNQPDKLIGVDFDITEHKAAEEKLRMLSDAVEQCPASIVITDLNGNIEYVNPKTTDITGYSFEELKGQNSRILKSGYTSGEEYAKLWSTIPTAEWRGVFHNRKKNGDLFWELARIRPILDISGKATHYLAVKEDITEQKAMEAALKESEERFRIAAENSGDIIYEWDIATDSVRAYGQKRDPSDFALDTAENFFRRLHPEDRERVKNSIARQLEEGTPYSEEYRTVSSSGEVRYWVDNGTAVRDATGKPHKWIGVLKDTTELQSAQRANAELAAIVESADTAIVSQDLQGQLLTWNAGAERMYGYSAREMIGRNVRDLITPERIPEEAGINQRCRLGQRTEDLETVRSTKSGELIYILLTVSPMLDRSGHVIGAARVSWNITELKLLQRQLAQAQKLESIGQLAAGIAHEINTPIQYIGDNAKFLDDAFRDLVRFLEPHRKLAAALRNSDHADSVAAVEQAVKDVDVDYLRVEIPKAIDQLLEGVTSVARIVRAMKEFSHPGPVEKVPANINHAIESTILVSKNEWKYVADLTTDFDPELPPVPCLASEFNQVILNLIVNAAHAIKDVVSNSGRKGSIRISTRRDAGWVEVRVSDTGAGIPEDIRSKIFTPFFTTKEVGKGTGQGLAISHSVIVKKHQGTIGFESQVGAGTTFIIRLPLECEVENV